MEDPSADPDPASTPHASEDLIPASAIKHALPLFYHINEAVTIAFRTRRPIPGKAIIKEPDMCKQTDQRKLSKKPN